jgi:fido (protein-threonine AMPylation protein)
MADIVLTRVYGARPIDWAGGHDLQKMGERRVAYIAALKAADSGNFDPLFKFAGAENHSQSTRGA